MNTDDIEIINVNINTSFCYAGKVFNGLEDLKNVAFDNYNKHDKMKDSPYVVIVEQKFPCFDYEDRMNENRYYQNYYLTTDKAKAERISEETQASYRFSGKPVLYPILEPKFSMQKIEERHLPYIYYHGDGDMMQIVHLKNSTSQNHIIILAK